MSVFYIDLGFNSMIYLVSASNLGSTCDVYTKSGWVTVSRYLNIYIEEYRYYLRFNNISDTGQYGSHNLLVRNVTGILTWSER